jgi:hypothetical protein
MTFHSDLPEFEFTETKMVRKSRTLRVPAKTREDAEEMILSEDESVRASGWREKVMDGDLIFAGTYK